jgi:spore germination protein YaaH
MSEKVIRKKGIGKMALPFGLLFVIVSIVFWFVYPFPSNEKIDYFTTAHPIIFKDKVLNIEGLQEEGKLLLPFSFIQEYIDESIHYDESSSSVIITTKQKVYQMPTDHLTYYVNQKEHSLTFPVIQKQNNEIYVETGWMEKVYPLEILYAEETGAFWIREQGDMLTQGKAVSQYDEDLFRLRKEPDITTPYVDELTVNEVVTIEGEEERYYKVRKSNGIAGFVKKEVIQLQNPPYVVKTNYKEDKEGFSIPELDWPIHLTWDAIYHPDATPDKVRSYEGVQILSPTWFHLDDNNGKIRSYAKEAYVKDAKEKGYFVWALFSNDFHAERTHEVLKDFETRQKVISQLLQYADIYKIDGYNIDFENVNLEDGPLLTQFMREFTPLAHEAGLVVSMDITFISTNEQYSMFYEREALKDIVDYLIVMAYDEHWATSSKSGSVASLPWVEENLQKLLEIVPNDSLILGVPLYTRLWTETLNDDGSTTIKSKALTMEEVADWIKEKQVTPTYDEESGQQYVEWTDKNKTYKIWLEDELSLQKRAGFVHKYQLAGIASWSEHFASEEIWKEIDESLRTKAVVIKPKKE